MANGTVGGSTVLKRQVPIAIVFITGLLTLFGWFVKSQPIESFLNDKATQWFDIIASFAMILGALNLLRVQTQKVLRRRKDWQYSLFAIFGFFFAIFAGFFWRGASYVELSQVGTNPQALAAPIAQATGEDPEIVAQALEGLGATDKFPINRIYFTESGAHRLQQKLSEIGAQAVVKEKSWGEHLLVEGTLFNWIFKYIFTPLGATMFALLAFFVASASYRAFRIRNFEATLLLASGIIIMLGRVPMGSYISPWFMAYLIVLGLGILVNSIWKKRMVTFVSVAAGLLLVTIGGALAGWNYETLKFLQLPILQEWIYSIPNVAGARAIMIGIALGMVGTSLRIILGIEKSFMGE